MNNFYKNLCLGPTYINIFYNICIGTVGKLSASNLSKSVNQNDLCRTLTNRVHTAMAFIASLVVLHHLHLRKYSSACSMQANFNPRFYTQYWPGTVAYPAGPEGHFADRRVNNRLSLCPLYACTKGKGKPLPCYLYA
jgi:hypothetical protein